MDNVAVESGEVTKLSIKAFADAACKERLLAEFTAMYNPKTYSMKHEIDYDKEQAKGVSSKELRYASSKPRSVSLEFTLDGTGVSGKVVEVRDEVEQFFRTAYAFHGKAHEPPFLLLVWGDLVMTCRLESANVTYTLFKPSGQPLRAKISASFIEIIPEPKRERQERRNSPDLTHVHVVVGSESLPQLCHLYYRDSRYYLRVAEVNGLLNFRRLEPGSTLRFPPIAKLRSK